MKSFMLLVLAATSVFGAAVSPRADAEIDWALVKRQDLCSTCIRANACNNSNRAFCAGQGCCN
ncbi:hypothetical protein CGMCC3_g9714 [Colletotrichum fructicola]|nr:uncharacterized protein CGMCC3_g9714 [Colletotrichum fructicola]KAE9574444.1 hypothetical protein CGMCC3_g9714 [Colletotrichum fructicola]